MKMFWKEFRECARSLPLAMIVFALVWWMMLPSREESTSGFDTKSGSIAALLGCVYALLLGVLQFWPLQRTDVRGWMLSQPISGRRLFWTMTIAAASVYLLAMLLPFLGTLWVLRTYLPTMAPIDPRSFYAAAMAYLFAFVLHPGTVWMLSRPARWVGSKTIVLTLPVGVFMLVVSAINAPSSMPWIALPILLGVAGTIWVFMVACDAFVVSSKMPSHWNQPPPPSRWNRRLAALGTLAAVAILVWTGSIVVSDFVTSKLRAREVAGEPKNALRFDGEGKPVLAKVTSRYNPKVGTEETVVAAYNLPSTTAVSEIQTLRRVAGQSDPITDPGTLKQMQVGSQLNSLRVGTRYRLFQWIGDYSNCHTSDGTAWFQNADGVLFGYNRNYPGLDSPVLQTKLDRSGFGSTETPFTGGAVSQLYANCQVRVSLGANEYFVDRDGVYEINVADQRFETLLDEKIDSAGLFESLGGHGWTLYTRHHLTVRIYDIVPTDKNTEMPSSPTDLPEGFVPSILWPKTRFELRQTVQLPADWFDFGTDSPVWGTDYLVDQGSGGFLVAQQKYASAIKTILIEDTGVTKSADIHAWPKPKPAHWAEMVHALLVPPALMLGSTVYGTWLWATGSPSFLGNFTEITIIGGLILTHLLIAWFWTRRACRQRYLNATESRWWQWAGCMFGIVVPVMVYCFHERVAVEECQECGTPVRVDELACPKCNQTHAKTPPRGIEIFAPPSVLPREEQLV